MRRKCDRLAYVDCGPDNGGILLEISEAGLSFQGVGALAEGEFLAVRFALPGMAQVIQAKGQLVWTNASKRGGGVRFLEAGQAGSGGRAGVYQAACPLPVFDGWHAVIGA